MGFHTVVISNLLGTSVVLFLITSLTDSAAVKDIFNLDTPQLTRLTRETQYYDNRYGSAASASSQIASFRPIKPEDAPEARDKDGANVEKRCIRCEYNRDYRYPNYDYRGRYDDRYDDRYRDRYDERYTNNRDRYSDDYDRRYYEGDRRYYDDRKYYDDRRYDDRYDRYDRDRYDTRRPEYYDRYDRDRYDSRDRNRYYDRYDRDGYRPWDETTRGTSGFDNSGRGYYFAVGRPEYSGGYGGGGYGGSYASNWNYGAGGAGGGGGGVGGGSGGGRDYNSRDRDRGWREQGNVSSTPVSFSSSSYRPRDPYDPGYYRGTSYLYGRPSSTTTTQPTNPPAGASAVTANPKSP